MNILRIKLRFDCTMQLDIGYPAVPSLTVPYSLNGQRRATIINFKGVIDTNGLKESLYFEKFSIFRLH
jgi:hypothetical protein